MKKLLLIGLILLSFFSYSFSQDNPNFLLGNPSNAKPDPKDSDNYLMIKPQYVLSYNNHKHTANWVAWELDQTEIGDAARQSVFLPDPSIPDGYYKVKSSDYTNSGFDRGHLCDSKDRTATVEDNQATFKTVNIFPQSKNNNEITWEHLEAYCRKLVLNNDDRLYIIAGSTGVGGEGVIKDSIFKTNEIRHHIVVPSNDWKIVVVTKDDGTNNINNITISTRVIAVIIPNTQSCNEKEWYEYRVKVKDIEDLTEFTFFTNLPVNVKNTLENKLDDIQIK